jgi:23S rRNA pseudouridine1911/1915/1917 synthase
MGNVVADEGTIEDNVARHVKRPYANGCFADPEIGKPVITHYKVLDVLVM